jgi:hypothetical protein
MRKMMIAALVAASLGMSACATTGTGKPPAPPSSVETLAPILAPLTGNHVTKEAIDLAFAASAAALYVIDFMRSVGWIEDGSPKALALADAAEILKRSLIVADTAQRAGEQTKADGAYSKAAAAYSLILKALER